VEQAALLLRATTTTTPPLVLPLPSEQGGESGFLAIVNAWFFLTPRPDTSFGVALLCEDDESELERRSF
jgi:hypothetical protein